MRSESRWLSYRIGLPSKFDQWLMGTGMLQGDDDNDPECLNTRLSWSEGEIIARRHGYTRQVVGDRLVIELLREYALYCLESNRDHPDQYEVKAAKRVIERADMLLESDEEF